MSHGRVDGGVLLHPLEHGDLVILKDGETTHEERAHDDELGQQEPSAALTVDRARAGMDQPGERHEPQDLEDPVGRGAGNQERDRRHEDVGAETAKNDRLGPAHRQSRPRSHDADAERGHQDDPQHGDHQETRQQHGIERRVRVGKRHDERRHEQEGLCPQMPRVLPRAGLGSRLRSNHERASSHEKRWRVITRSPGMQHG